MGHIRLGTIPKSQPWHAVVDSLIGAERAVSSQDRATVSTGLHGSLPRSGGVAHATLEATNAALVAATGDEGLRYTFYQITQVVLASRQADWLGALRAIGIELPSSGTIFDLSAAFQASIDDHLLTLGRSTDFSEIAQRAAGEALCGLAGTKSETLFGNSGEELRLAVRSLSTKDGFGQISQRFFGRFLAYFLNFYISRISAKQIGSTTIPSLGAVSALDRALVAHCQQSAAILRDFSTEWFSKAQFEGGIDPLKAAGFVAVAVSKLRAELAEQKAGR